LEHCDRYEEGRKKIGEIFGESGERVIASLSDIAPDLGTYIVEFAFGEFFTRPGLDAKSREIVEILIQMAVYAGFPAGSLQDWGGLGGTKSFTSKFMMKGDSHPSIRVERL
jgi:4-carboxymuconolactone decarboxylase